MYLPYNKQHPYFSIYSTIHLYTANKTRDNTPLCFTPLETEKLLPIEVKVTLQLSPQITGLQSGKKLFCEKINGHYSTRIETLT